MTVMSVLPVKSHSACEVNKPGLPAAFSSVAFPLVIVKPCGIFQAQTFRVPGVNRPGNTAGLAVSAVVVPFTSAVYMTGISTPSPRADQSAERLTAPSSGCGVL
ncbi:hypothetical protein [uncultured Odoribacter sp.]|uniref:hypothetical protein n=1 Tax=uncultured Odoribacter sp. TaxID=876416 RepID=UPI00262F98B2|nr:hypothetical protein [uncultured Odoribacter sp.]